MRSVTFHPEAWDEFTDLAAKDPKLFTRVVRIIKECVRSPFTGIGKPEPLKHHYKGHWSRRISSEHRLVYLVSDEAIVIVSCESHYE